MRKEEYMIGALLITVVLFFSAVVVYHNAKKHAASTNVNPTAVECERDADCVRAGCSSQLCVARDKADAVVTTCEWRDEYACYSKDNCGCINKKCQWQGNDQYAACLNAIVQQ